MSALNWEKDKARRARKDQADDHPPLTGSFADQARYGVFPRLYAQRRVQPSPCRIRNREKDFVELRRYAEHISHPDFRGKSAAQQAELVAILGRLLQRCVAWGTTSSDTERQILGVARRALEGRFQRTH
jgi:hypothetical protein